MLDLDAAGREAFIGSSILTRLQRGRAYLAAKEYGSSLSDFAIVRHLALYLDGALLDRFYEAPLAGGDSDAELTPRASVLPEPGGQDRSAPACLGRKLALTQVVRGDRKAARVPVHQSIDPGRRPLESGMQP